MKTNKFFVGALYLSNTNTLAIEHSLFYRNVGEEGLCVLL